MCGKFPLFSMCITFPPWTCCIVCHNILAKCLTFHSMLFREVCNEGPGQPSPWGKHHTAVRWDCGSHLLHPARGHQQKHGERQGLGRHRRHREAGQHHQGQRRQVCYSSMYLSKHFLLGRRVHADTNPTQTCTCFRCTHKHQHVALDSGSFTQTFTKWHTYTETQVFKCLEKEKS